MIRSEVDIVGLQDIQSRVTQLGLRAKDLRRPNASVAQSVVLANRLRLDAGVDVNGVPLRSQRSKQLGLTPLGGGSGLFGRSLKGDAAADGPEIYSTFIGAGVAYRGDTIVPKRKKYLTIPARAKGGELAGQENRSVRVLANRRGDRAAHYSSKTTFVLRRAGGKLMIVQKQTGGALRVLFFLVKKARYPKNEWAGFSNDDQDKAMAVYEKHLDTYSDQGAH